MKNVCEYSSHHGLSDFIAPAWALPPPQPPANRPLLRSIRIRQDCFGEKSSFTLTVGSLRLK